MADKKATKDVKKGKNEEPEEEEEPAEPERLFQPESYAAADTVPVDSIDRVHLTPEHQQSILQTWDIMAEQLDEHGPRIFRRIFEVSPKIQSVFKVEDADVKQRHETNPILIKHSRRFMEAIEYAVMNMDQLEGDQNLNKVAEVFMNLGAHHIHFEGLQGNHFGVFTGSILYVLNDTLGDSFTKEARAAWSRILDYLIQHIQHGWQEAINARDAKQT